MSKLITYAALFVLTLAALGACGPNQSSNPCTSRSQLSVDIIPPESIQKPEQAQKVPIVAQGQSMNFIAEAKPSGVTFAWIVTGSGTLTNENEQAVQYTAPTSVSAPKDVTLTVTITEQATGCVERKTFTWQLVPNAATAAPTAPSSLAATAAPQPTDVPPSAATNSPAATATAIATPTVTATPSISALLGINVRAGDQVAQTVTLMGEFPPDFVGDLWVMIVPPNDLYYPQSPNACKGEGTPKVGNRWELRVGFGGAGDEGIPFKIVLVAADPAASREFARTLRQWCQTQKYPGLEKEQLPAGARELGPAIEVTRSAERWGPAPEISNTQLPGQVTFANVADKDQVSQRQNIAGQYSGDVADKLWVLVYASNGRWYAQSTNACRGVHTRISDGKWQVLTGFGGAGNVGEPFDIAVVLADAAANEFFDSMQKKWCQADNYLGFLTIELPQGISEKGRIRVTRK
jgi:hypothetical protein